MNWAFFSSLHLVQPCAPTLGLADRADCNAPQFWRQVIT